MILIIRAVTRFNLFTAKLCCKTVKPNKFTLTNHSNRQNASVQHRFGGMQDGRKMAAMRNVRNFNGGMRDKITSVGAGCAHFDRREAGYM